jgi:hypothetical protein
VRVFLFFFNGINLILCFLLSIIFVVLSIVFICATWKVLLLLLLLFFWKIQDKKTNTLQNKIIIQIIYEDLRKKRYADYLNIMKRFFKGQGKNFIFRSKRRIEQLFTSLFVNDIISKLQDIIIDKRLSTII